MKTVLVIVFMSILIIVSGCALGSATAAYSIKAQTAESLTAEYEEVLSHRIEERILLRLKARD